MHSANSTTTRLKRTALFIFAIFTYTFSFAQENSPYSRYGLGDLVPAQNMVSRSMGGISAGFVDSSGFAPYSQSINLANPAALGSLNTTLFDLGGEIDVRTLKSNVSPDKYRGTNTIISYLQLGFPITSKRMLAKGNYWGVSFGLRPLTRVNYKISADKRLAGIDSITTIYEGNGGVQQANFSTGVKIKNFSFGVSSGYSFGNRQTGTKISFNNDSVKYQQSNTQADSRFGGFFLDLGLQYGFRLSNGTLRIGADADLQQNLKGKRNNINETFQYSGSTGSLVAIDTVTYSKDQKGVVKIPATYTAGFTYTNSHWLFGADVEMTQWKQYSYFGAQDNVQNNFTLHFGGQYYPAKLNTPSTKYWSFVKYRAGAYYGNDYVKLSTNRPDFGLNLGLGMPLTSFQRLRFGDFATLNAGIDVGQHGNKQNLGLRETILRVNVGFSMTAAWFQKRKYD